MGAGVAAEGDRVMQAARAIARAILAEASHHATRELSCVQEGAVRRLPTSLWALHTYRGSTFVRRRARLGRSDKAGRRLGASSLGNVDDRADSAVADMPADKDVADCDVRSATLPPTLN